MENQQETNKQTLEEYISFHQKTWSDLVTEMNAKMKKFSDIPDLQNVVYAKRQDALDYYFILLGKVADLVKNYRVLYAKQYNYYKTTAQIRYSSDTAINAQIDSDLSVEKYHINLLDNHAKYMQETIKTIDSIIYGINNRIRVEELISGVK